MSDLTTLTSPFTAAQARALLSPADIFPLYVAEADPDEPDLSTAAGRHELMRSLDDPFDVPTLAVQAADALRDSRKEAYCL